MKKNLKFFAGALTTSVILGGAILASCTSEETDGLLTGSNVIGLAKAPNVVAYSGDMVFGNTFANRGIATRSNAGDGDLNNQVWKDFNADQLTNITNEERQAVLDAIKEKVTGERISEDVVFPWENYFLQDVISGQNGNWDGAGSNGTSSSSYSFEAYNKGAECNTPWWSHCTSDEAANYEEVTNSAHLNNYFQKQNADGTQERINETTLMTGMKYGTYEEMKGKQFRWYINCHENLHWYEYIVVKVEGSYYICFDFGCGYPENDKDGHAGKGAEHNDWDYNDWILKITPAGNQPNVWTGDEEDDDSDTCDKCGHPEHNENCPECGEDEGCNKSEDTPIPSVPIAPQFQNEVEVNLHGVEKNGDYLESHLSIHVRYATDVEIFIPVPAMYYCDADDMAIVNKHEENLMVHGGPTKLEYNINENLVTLNINFQDDGIKIWTDGINEAVIKYCRETYGDGITFEIWNYFNIPDKEKGKVNISLDELQDYLNQATIEFLDDIPEYYVNAFYYSYDDEGERGTEENSNDCTVSVVDSQKGQFTDATDEFDGKWWNGSPYNEIYKRNSVKPEPPVY